MKSGTELPWRIDRYKTAGGAPIIVGISSWHKCQEREVAKVLYAWGSEDPEVEPNAAYIVHACNAHPKLVDALNRIIHYACMGAAVCDVNTSEQPEFVNARAILKECEK